MRWFKHMTDTRSDERILIYMSRFNRKEERMEAYGFWWKLLEVIAKNIPPKGDAVPALSLPISSWASYLGCHHNKVRKYFAALASGSPHYNLIGLASEGQELAKAPVKKLPNKCEVTVGYVLGKCEVTVKSLRGICRVEIPKLLKYRDEYSRKIRTISGQYPAVDTDTDTDTEGESPPTPPAAARPVRKTPPTSQPAVMLPDWIPPVEWAAFLEMRVRMRRPATRHAQRLIINKLEKYRRQGHAPPEILNQSIEHSWQGVYPIEASNGRRAYVSRERQKVDATIAAVERVIARSESAMADPGLQSAGDSGDLKGS